MTKPVSIDTSVVLDAVKTAIGNGRPSDAIKVLNDLIPAQGIVLNNILVEEFLFEPKLNNPYYTQIMAERNLIQQWLDQTARPALALAHGNGYYLDANGEVKEEANAIVHAYHSAYLTYYTSGGFAEGLGDLKEVIFEQLYGPGE